VIEWVFTPNLLEIFPLLAAFNAAHEFHCVGISPLEDEGVDLEGGDPYVLAILATRLASDTRGTLGL
jgi:hypothetical protein